MDLVIGGPFGDGLKSANSTLTVHLDGHPHHTAAAVGISTNSSDATKPASSPSSVEMDEVEASALERAMARRASVKDQAQS